MFLRIVKARGGKGVQHEYVRLVEAYREDGQPKQRVVCNLGRKDLLAEHLDSLNWLLGGKRPRGTVRVDGIEAAQAWDWGPMLVVRLLWEELGFERILQQKGGRNRVDGQALSDRALVLIANRLCAPTSEHGLARWLETDFVCDHQGRQWVPQWRDDGERKSSRLPRVRVELRQLKQWYRTLDQLHRRKADIEKALFLQLRELFALKVDMVLYDVTSTYFEGQGPPDKGKHGHSRDGKPRNRQVLVGCVMIDGWPIAHHVFAGNTRDSVTVPSVLADLQQRFGLRRVVFVGDRGMVTSDNLELLRKEGHGYLVGRQRRRSKEVFRYVEQANEKGDWTDCPVGITASEKKDPPRTRVQEVDAGEPGVRVFVVRSDDRLDYERGQRTKVMERARADFERLAKRVREGRIKAPQKIGAAAERILKRHHGYRYFGWELTDSEFRFFDHPVNLERELAYEGTYVIQTEEKDLNPVEAVRLYKELSEVERAFCNLKDIIELRPVFHQRDDRVEAHVFVAALAFLLHRAIEKKLKAAGLDLSATEALQALRTVRVVDIELGDHKTKRSVTHGSRSAAAILRAFGVTERKPPTPPNEDMIVA
jgi:transposase